MPRQRHPGIHPERAARRPGEQQPAGDPGHRPTGGPADVGQCRSRGRSRRATTGRSMTRHPARRDEGARRGDAGGEDACGIQPEGDDDDAQHEPVAPPHLPPCGRARVGGRREAGELQRRGRVGEVLGHGRGTAREGGRDAEGRSHEGDLGDGEAQERTSRQPGVEVGDRRAPVPPPCRAECDEEHGLGDEEQAVGREEVGPGGEPRGRGHHSRCAHRGVGPERQRRVAAGHDREPTSEGAVQRDEDDEATDPHRGPDEVQPHRVDRRLVVVRRAGVAGQAEHEDAGGGEGGQPRRGPSATGQGRTARHDEAQPALIRPIRVASISQTRSASWDRARCWSAAGPPRPRRSAPPRPGLRRSRRDLRSSRAAAPGPSPTAPRLVPADAHRPGGAVARPARRVGVGDDRGREDERSERHGGGYVVPDPHERHRPPHERARVLDEDERLHRARRPRRHGAREQAADDRDERRRGRRQPRAPARRRRHVEELTKPMTIAPNHPTCEMTVAVIISRQSRRGRSARLDVCRQPGQAATQG